MPARHLILIRGNSAAGKTTLAASLQRRMGRGTANIGQDHFRRIVLREHDVPGGANIRLIVDTARGCLQLGYHVIIEGILYEPHYGDALRQLVAGHDGPSHVFYLDADLPETLRRHEQRALSAEVSPQQLREWFHPMDLLGCPGEHLIDARRPADVVLDDVASHVGPVVALPDPTGARFLA